MEFSIRTPFYFGFWSCNMLQLWKTRSFFEIMHQGKVMQQLWRKGSYSIGVIELCSKIRRYREKIISSLFTGENVNTSSRCMDLWIKRPWQERVCNRARNWVLKNEERRCSPTARVPIANGFTTRPGRLCQEAIHLDFPSYIWWYSNKPGKIRLLVHIEKLDVTVLFGIWGTGGNAILNFSGVSFFGLILWFSEYSESLPKSFNR